MPAGDAVCSAVSPSTHCAGASEVTADNPEPGTRIDPVGIPDVVSPGKNRELICVATVTPGERAESVATPDRNPVLALSLGLRDVGRHGLWCGRRLWHRHEESHRC